MFPRDKQTNFLVREKERHGRVGQVVPVDGREEVLDAGEAPEGAEREGEEGLGRVEEAEEEAEAEHGGGGGRRVQRRDCVRSRDLRQGRLSPGW